VAEDRVVLARAEKPFWLVDAVIREGELTVCSGDAHREWYVIVAASERLPLLHALRTRCGRQAPPGEAPEREMLELLAQAFRGRTGLYEEIEAFFSEAGIPPAAPPSGRPDRRSSLTSRGSLTGGELAIFRQQSHSREPGYSGARRALSSYSTCWLAGSITIARFMSA
jgi:hypothetical protein